MLAAFIIGLAISGMVDKENEEKRKRLKYLREAEERKQKQIRALGDNYHQGLKIFTRAIHVGNESSVKNHITFRRLLRKSLVYYKKSISYYLTRAEYYQVESSIETNLFRKIHSFYLSDGRFPQTVNFHISDNLNKIILHMDYNQYRAGVFVLIRHGICGELLKYVFTFVPKKI